MPKIKVNCENCEKELLKWKSQIPNSGKAFCSLKCSTSYRNKYEFNPSHHRDISGERNPMYRKGYKITGERNGMYGRSGALNPAYKGGRHKRKDGYIRVLVDGERILEHRKILEDKGVDIKDKVVHHKDRNKSNNSPENLSAMTRKEHIEEHRQEMQESYKNKYASS